jgi:acetoin utilization deacetylase AcuC-like enzyme
LKIDKTGTGTNHDVRLTSQPRRVKKSLVPQLEPLALTTLLIRQEEGLSHYTPRGHLERPERLQAIKRALSSPHFSALDRREAQSCDLAIVEIVHDPIVLQILRQARPSEGLNQIDADTFLSPRSFEAAATAIGATLQALDAVVLEGIDNAFCAIRPPGHHAERKRPMGFCLFNTIAIAAREAQRKHGAERVAIVDFDVHHGNGTQDIFYDDASVFYASSHQMPLFPGTGTMRETGVGNIFNAPLPAGSGRSLMRQAYRDRILPALDEFTPDLILISAGFDAEMRDPLAQLEWQAEDFAWVTGKIMDIADKHCSGRIVSLLEGGYDLYGLADGVAAHVGMLLHAEGVAEPAQNAM